MDQQANPPDAKAGAELSAIEKQFPRIAKALCELWGQEGYAPYLRSLVFDERGNRQGFPPDVSMELFMLHGLLDYRVEGDVWTQADSRV
jgi:hypothetical protein